MREESPQTGRSIFLGPSECGRVDGGIDGLGEMYIDEGTGKLLDFSIEVLYSLYDLCARPGVRLCHEHVKGLYVGHVLVMVGWDAVDGSGGSCRGLVAPLGG